MYSADKQRLNMMFCFVNTIDFSPIISIFWKKFQNKDINAQNPDKMYC